MNQALRADADAIVSASIRTVLADEAVCRALIQFTPEKGRTLLVAAGKAAWQMAKAAVEALGRVDGGIVVTKYGHVKGDIPGVACYEAGHPVPDEVSFFATGQALSLVENAGSEDTVLFLLSGGGSALFEKPLIPGEELQDITRQFLACGADIVEMNTLRKRLSAVKGGRFAQACAPARVFSIVLSEIILSSVLKTHASDGRPMAFIAGGETVVHLTGKGKGGRNQELAPAAAPGIAGLQGAAVFSVGSDGTDGPPAMRCIFAICLRKTASISRYWATI